MNKFLANKTTITNECSKFDTKEEVFQYAYMLGMHEVMENVNIFIRSRLPRVIDEYISNDNKKYNSMLNENIRKELDEYILSKLVQ